MAHRHPDPDLHELTRREFPRLVGMLALYVGNRQAAEDMAQETLIKLHQHWPRVKVMDSQTAWLSRVALNLANSSLRRGYAERRATARLGGCRAPAPLEAPEILAIRDAVASLPQRERTVIVLRFYLGMSVAETAGELRCPEGTVKSLTSRAVGQLRGRIGPPLPERRPSHV